ncbi:hypothetical protein JR334_05135 [Clostridia bacterium]|nr:hypothetical protein JR334_05135 [Clostridia bacterium]
MSVKTNLKAVESMLVFWSMVSEKEKVSDLFIQDLADMDEFKASFDSEFTKDSFTKILSAVSNKELLNGMSKKEGRFWNYNLWMLEDMEFVAQMVDPLKKLNLDSLEASGDVEVVFVPMNMQESFINDGKLYINFFKTMYNEFEETTNIDGKEISAYIQEKIAEM